MQQTADPAIGIGRCVMGAGECRQILYDPVLLSPKQKAGTTKTNEVKVKETTYLGVTFDKRLKEKPHIAHSERNPGKILLILAWQNLGSKS